MFMTINKPKLLFSNINFGKASNCLSVNKIASVLRGLNLISHCFAQAANNCRSWLIMLSISTCKIEAE